MMKSITETKTALKMAASLVVVAFLISCIFAIAISETAPSLVLSAEELLIPKWNGSQISATLTGTKTKLVWESDNPSVATVVNGYISGKQNGTATIKCSTVLSDGKELAAACIVTVYTPIQSLKTIQTILIDEGQEMDAPEITFFPVDASYQTVEWTSDNEEIVSISDEGKIIGVSEGTCKITATSLEPVKGKAVPKSVSCKVTVYRPVSSITLSAQDNYVLKGKTIQIDAKVFPENATNKKLTWESSNVNIASVFNGKVTGKNGGNVTIKCSISNQTGEIISSECHLNVISPVTFISAQSYQNIVNVGMTSNPLSVKIQPADATCQDVTWQSKDNTIATVDSSGRVTGIKAGKTMIVAISADPYAVGAPKTCTFQVTVNQGAEKLVITGDKTVAKGKTVKLNWTVSPDDTTNKRIEWSSSDDKIARVSNGFITGVGVGSCTITGKMVDGSGIFATHEITVIQAVTQIQPVKQRIAVTEGKTASLSVTVFPKDATNKKVTWSSDSSYIATVDSYGRVTAKSAGTCTITATAADGSGKFAKMTVVVEPKIPLDATKLTKSGYFGAYYEFAVTFKNLTKTRTIKYLDFDLKYSYSGKTQTLFGCYADNEAIGPGGSRQIGWWDQIGYRLSYCSNFRIYLRSVMYSDGTWDYFNSEEALIGWFN